MPQCPKCNAAVWVGQQYCSTCGNLLPQAEGKGYFCPQCGLSMASPQETCRRCKAAPPEITGIPLTAPARSWRLPFKVPGIFWGAGLIFVGLILVSLFQKSPEPPHVRMTPPPQAVSSQPSAAPLTPAPKSAPAAPKLARVRELAVPAATAASSPPEAATPLASPPRYRVNINGLSVRDGPNMSATRIAILKFKAEVELLDTSGGWGKVRDVERNMVGWSYMRYLKPVAAAAPQAVSRHRPSGPQKP